MTNIPHCQICVCNFIFQMLTLEGLKFHRYNNERAVGPSRLTTITLLVMQQNSTHLSTNSTKTLNPLSKLHSQGVFCHYIVTEKHLSKTNHAFMIIVQNKCISLKTTR